MNTPQIDSHEFGTLDEIASAVVDNGGTLTLRMYQLRDAHGAGRLGVHIRTGISAALEERAIGHYPNELPGDQNDYVRLYKLGTPVADLIRSVLTRGPAEDEKLLQYAGGDAAKTLQRIRELVCL